MRKNPVSLCVSQAVWRMAFGVFVFAALFSLEKVSAADSPPNFIFVIADDVGFNDLGCYGHPTIKTPNLDQLANNGLRFENAFLTISSCSPSRCSIITGRYPHNTGAPELHTSLPPDQYLFPQTLRKNGYYTVLSGKNHMGKTVSRAFEKISGGRGPGREGDWVEILKNRPADKPFFFWFASTDAHRDWKISEEAPQYDPADVVVPPFLVDGPLTRKDLAEYYHEVSRVDHYVGKLMQELKRQQIAEDTYLIFCADNGRPFPRCKTRLYDSGIRTPLIISRPGKIQPAVSSSLVSSIDIAPAVLELAGQELDPRVQGISFVPILDDYRATTRDFVFAEHNWHVFQAHERMIRTKDFLLIQNNFPNRMNMCVESAKKFPSGKELWDAYLADKAESATGKLSAAQLDLFSSKRSPLEFYNVKADPFQTRNLADEEEQAELISRLTGQLKRWKEETGDTVPASPTPDRDDVDGKKVAGFRRGEMPGAARKASMINHPGPRRFQQQD